MADDLPVEESEHAALPSMPDEIWRKIASFATPSPTSRALVVAAGADASRRTALRSEIENGELEAYGMTRDEALHRAKIKISLANSLIDSPTGDAWHRRCAQTD